MAAFYRLILFIINESEATYITIVSLQETLSIIPRFKAGLFLHRTSISDN